MSLKQEVPGFQVSSAGLGSTLPVPRPLAAVAVSFRNGADLSHVVEAVKAGGNVSVDAAPAAGKTTVLPLLLAEALSVPVVHVFPNKYLAADQYDYIRAGKCAVPLQLMETGAEPIIEKGWVFVSAAALVAKWLAAGASVMPPCVIYHDEAHESDAYTYVVRSLGPSVSGVSAYVRATATSGPGGHRRMESGGTSTVRKFDARLMRARPWDVYDKATPWCVDTFRGHVLIFEENSINAQTMVAEYNRAGCQAMRFHSRMGLDKFRANMAALRSRTGNICVVIADSTFRSGFTFPVSHIVDTAEVSCVAVHEGRPVTVVRDAYALELHQAACRGARGLRQECAVWQPDLQVQELVCDLQAADMEAAALVLRLIGREPPRELAGCAMAVGDVPRDPSAALRGGMPLALMHASQLTSVDSLAMPDGRKSPYLRQGYEAARSWDAEDSGVSADLARSRGMGPLAQVGRDEVDLQVGGRDPTVVKRDSGVSLAGDAADALAAMLGVKHGSTELEFGKYYYAAGVEYNASPSASFPDGVLSVLRVVGRDDPFVAARMLSPQARANAVWLVLADYNMATCEIRAVSAAVGKARVAAVGKDPGALQKWARRCTERLAELSTRERYLRGILVALSEGFCALDEFDGFQDEEAALLAEAFVYIGELPDCAMGPPVEFVRDVSQWANGVASAHGATVRVVHGLETVRMPTRGAGSRAVGGATVGMLKWLAGAGPKRGGVVRHPPR